MKNPARAAFVQAALLCLFAALAPPPAKAQAFPAYLNYQGKLSDPSGNPKTGTFSFQFDLYSQASGGTLLFTDANFSGSNPVAVVNGLYSVQIGSLAAGGIPPSVFFTPEVWLEIRVKAGTSLAGAETLTPRERLAAAPFAIRAAAAEHLGYGVAIATYSTDGVLHLPYGLSAATVTATSSITASAFFGDGSHLTGVSAAAVPEDLTAATLRVSSANATSATTIFQVSSGPAASQELFTVMGDGRVLIRGLGVGHGAGGVLSTTALGYRALASNALAPFDDSSTVVGSQAGENITSGAANDLFGAVAGGAMVTGSYNAAFGSLALSKNTQGRVNVAFGRSALQNYDDTLGGNDGNTAVGANALMGAANAGALAGDTAIGFQAGMSMTAVGASFFGRDNTLVGWNAGSLLSTGFRNIMLGENGAVTTGSRNIILGNDGGITTGADNILIGNALVKSTPTQNGQIDIGDVIIAVGGNVGLGTASPASRLHVSSGVLTVDGAGGALDVSVGSVTASAFFGDGSHLTGISVGIPAEVAVSTLDALGATPYGGINITTNVIVGGSARIGSNSANYLTFAGGAAGNSTVIATAGTDSNSDITLSPKGGGNVIIYEGGQPWLGIGTQSPATFLDVAGAPNYGGDLIRTSDRAASASVSSFGGIHLQSGVLHDVLLGKFSHSNGVTADYSAFQLRDDLGAVYVHLDLESAAGRTAGSFGIGTSTPATTLDVNGAAQFGFGAAKSTFSATGALTFDPGYSPSGSHDAATKGYVDGIANPWSTSGSQVLLANAANNVVMQSTLTVLGTGFTAGDSASMQLHLADDDTSDAFGLGAASSNGRKLTLTSRQGANQQGLLFADAGAGGADDPMFGVVSSLDSGATWLQNLVIKQNGRVGFGTANPATKLHMSSGTLTIDGSAATGLQVYGSTFVVQKSGFVGVGIGAPQNPLSVVAPNNAQAAVAVDGTNLGASEAIALNGLAAPSNSFTGKALTANVGSETFARGVLYSNGTFGMGPGTATRDVYFGRAGAGALQIGGNYDLTGSANLSVNGTIESTSGGVKFPGGSVQTIAAVTTITIVDSAVQIHNFGPGVEGQTADCGAGWTPIAVRCMGNIPQNTTCTFMGTSISGTVGECDWYCGSAGRLDMETWTTCAKKE